MYMPNGFQILMEHIHSQCEQPWVIPTDYFDLSSGAE